MNIHGWHTEWSLRAAGWALDYLSEKIRTREAVPECTLQPHLTEMKQFLSGSLRFLLQCHHPILISKKRVALCLGQPSSLGSSILGGNKYVQLVPYSSSKSQVFVKCPVTSSLKGCKSLDQFLVIRLVAAFDAVFEGGASEPLAAPTSTLLSSEWFWLESMELGLVIQVSLLHR